jgi:hypothetical protein
MTLFQRRIHPGNRRFYGLATLAALLVGWLGAPAAHAQVEVYISVARHSYILYEPIPATITITNNAGRDLTFEDAGGKQWLDLEVTGLGGEMLSPYDTDYKLHPLHVAAGQTLQRSIDLTPLFPIREMGTHRLRANVYLADLDKFFYSNYASFDLTDGKLLWQKTVGVPGSQDLRQVSVLTHELPDRLLLYVRIREQDGNTVYTTQSLGRLLVSGREPQEMLDSHNNVHVLQESKPGAFLYTCVGLDGQRLIQQAYNKTGTKPPVLARLPDGEVEVHGGQIQVAPAKGVGAPPPQPKLSDRPTALPTPVRDRY